MTQTHISYQTAKSLKEFCPELPEPMGGKYYDTTIQTTRLSGREKHDYHYPAYQLHDLLSKPFCEALAKKNPKHDFFEGDEPCDIPYDISVVLTERYYEGGLPAVEACLMKMIGGK